MNMYLNIDDFVKKFKCTFNCKRLYKKEKYYSIAYKTAIVYDLEKAI